MLTEEKDEDELYPRVSKQGASLPDVCGTWKSPEWYLETTQGLTNMILFTFALNTIDIIELHPSENSSLNYVPVYRHT